MKLSTLVAAFAGVAHATGPSPLFANPADTSKIPSSYESAVLGRRVLALSKLATLSTVFPDTDPGSAGSLENRPAGLSGVPIGLMDYVADCEADGNPTVLAIKIATSFKNVAAGSNITLSMHWAPPYPPAKRIGSFASRVAALLSGSADEGAPPDTVPYSAANLPRFSLLGYLEPIAAGSADLAACFTAKHRDARYWLPGNAIHESEWARLVVTQVYWIGGFGDRAYIGWIPVEEWRNVTSEEWQAVKLPGEEKGWSEWSYDETGEL